MVGQANRLPHHVLKPTLDYTALGFSAPFSAAICSISLFAPISGLKIETGGSKELAKTPLFLLIALAAAGAEESASAGTELTGHAETMRALVEEMREMVGAA
jgi:hypothetical protein